MGYRWFQNFFQFPMDINYDDTLMSSIPYPYVELGIHTTFKTVQIGSFVGGWILPGIMHGINKTTPLKNKMRLYGRYGVLIGKKACLYFCCLRIYAFSTNCFLKNLMTP